MIDGRDVEWQWVFTWCRSCCALPLPWLWRRRHAAVWDEASRYSVVRAWEDINGRVPETETRPDGGEAVAVAVARLGRVGVGLVKSRSLWFVALLVDVEVNGEECGRQV